MTAARAPILAAVLALLLLPGRPAGSQDRELVVGTKVAAPFAIKNADGSWSGLSIELWKQAAAELGIRYRFEEATLPELLGGVAEGRFDAVVAAVTVTPEREESFDFTHPFYRSGLGIATLSKPGGWTAALARFVSLDFLKVVAALACVLLVAGTLVWAFERRGNPDQFGGGVRRGLGTAFWWSAVTMTTVGYGDVAPRTTGGRAVALVWMFVSVIIISSFTAAITATVTLGELQTTVRGPEDLGRVRVGTVRGSAAWEYLVVHGVRASGFADVDQALGALGGGDLDAVVYDAPILQYVIGRDEALGSVRVLPEMVEQQSYAIALPAGSPLREPLNRAMLRIMARDAWRATLRRHLQS